MSPSLLVAVLLSLLAATSFAQTTTYSFCFTSSSLPNSPYGPWSVATSGVLTVNSTATNQTGTPANAGGQRFGYQVVAVNGQRTQLNRDGTTSSATLGLCPTGVQGSDNVVFPSAPYTDWNGICLAVLTSTDRPYPGATNWIVYPNDFPTQQVELYYDLPTYNYPTEYHHDNQTNGQMTVVAGSTVPSCTATPLSSTQTASLMYQFCYQAYSSSGNWQVAIQGTFLTKTAMQTSTISSATGMYILSVTGTRYQVVNGQYSSVPIVGQSWINSGGGDANEYNDDPLLTASAPHLVPGYGFVLYVANQFTYPNGSLSAIDNQYARAYTDPLIVNAAGQVVEQQSPTPDWSQLAVTCGSSCQSCPIIKSSSNAAPDSTLSASCSATGSGSFLPSSPCTGTPYNGAPQTVSAVSMFVLLAAAAIAALMW